MWEMRISLEARLIVGEANQRIGVVIGDMSDQEEGVNEAIITNKTSRREGY